VLFRVRRTILGSARSKDADWLLLAAVANAIKPSPRPCRTDPHSCLGHGDWLRLKARRIVGGDGDDLAAGGALVVL